MCDTVAIITPGRVFFAKNSDRDPNETQSLEWRPRCRHASGEMVRCTWIEISQAKETRAVLLSRPFWMWGAEMGANEDGVVIGNEAVFTTQPYADNGLTGMDLVRLALERSHNAEEACRVIIALLETHGQGGGCGYENRKFTYHNSFLIVDRQKGYVLETAGRFWACEAIQGLAAISNGLTLPGFAEKHSDFIKTSVSACRMRRTRTLSNASNARTTRDMFSLLRDHGPGNTYPVYSRLNGGMAAPCMHAGGTVAAAQTTASWVSELGDGGDRHWVTGTSAPCTSLFKPVSVDSPMDLGSFPDDTPDAGLWWMHEQFHRQVMKDPHTAFPIFEAERDALEKAWLACSPDSQTAFSTHQEMLKRWSSHPDMDTLTDKRPKFVRHYWKKRRPAFGSDKFL